MNNFDELLCTSRLKIISFNEGAHSSPFFVATSTTTKKISKFTRWKFSFKKTLGLTLGLALSVRLSIHQSVCPSYEFKSVLNKAS